MIRALAVALVLLAVGGVIGVRFLKSTRGAVFLVDRGIESAYPRVQRDVSAALKRALTQKGLRHRIRARDTGAYAGAGEAPLVWDVSADDSTDLLQVNLAMTDALDAIGAVVRRSEEADRGRTLVFHVGSHTRDTHRLTVRRLARDQPPPPPAARGPRVAIVIDDFGYTKGGIAGEMLALDLPLTVAILPRLRHSRDVFDMARARGHCVLLHLPMEANEPYPSDLTPIDTEMTDDTAAALVRDYLASLPGVDGVNNHQGSLATADPRVMRAVCAALVPAGVFFLDSLTSPRSVAYTTAVDAGLPAAVNSLFLDDATDRREDVETNLRELVRRAREHGSAIGIGHPHPWTYDALCASLDYLETSGVELVTVCDLLNRTPHARSPRAAE